MKKIQMALKKELNNYPKIKVYNPHQTKFLTLVALILLIIGLFVEYAYFSSIGHLGYQIALEILKIHLTKLLLILGFILVLDSGLTLLTPHRPKTITQLLCHPFERPALLFGGSLILMLSLDAPISVYCISIVIMTVMAQLFKRKTLHVPLHPVLIGYLVGVVGTYWVNRNFGIYQTPPMFMAPFMSVSSNLGVMSFEEFSLSYYSLQTVVFGLFEGSLAGILILPLLFSSVFLMKRQCLAFRSSGLYLLSYALISGLLLSSLHLETWVIILFLLNGSMLMTAVFLLPETKSLPRSNRGLVLYIIGLAALSVIFSYYVHFVFGPYLALGLFQIGLGVIRFVQMIMFSKFKKESTTKDHSHQVAM